MKKKMERRGFTGNEKSTYHSPKGCVYLGTHVVSVSEKEVMFDTGGWRTATTKKRMCQWLATYAPKWAKVTSIGGDWFLELLDYTGRVSKDVMFDGDVLVVPREILHL